MDSSPEDNVKRIGRLPAGSGDAAGRLGRQGGRGALPQESADAGPDADRHLVKRCLAGEVAAWEQLYAQCHDPLCVSIRILLGPAGRDANVVDEIAAKVWYALVADDGKLLARYSPQRGARLITFMRAVAKDQIGRHFRSEIRRRKRERVAGQARLRRLSADSRSLLGDFQEFLPLLSPEERRFCHEVLLAEPGMPAPKPRSKANIWQLTHRIHHKLRGFLGRDELG